MKQNLANIPNDYEIDIFNDCLWNVVSRSVLIVRIQKGYCKLSFMDDFEMFIRAYCRIIDHFSFDAYIVYVVHARISYL